MRTPALFWFAATALLAQTKPAVVDGKIVNSITGETLRKVEVTLATSLVSEQMEAMMMQLGGGVDPDGPGPGAPKTERKSFSATTDASGKFHFEAPAGDYYLTAKHAGYVDLHYKPRGKFAVNGKIHLAAADEMTDVVMRMTPQGAVSGRVIDEDGDPVAGAMVTAQSYSYAGGKRRLTPGDSGQTNDRGEFRLGKLAPGQYYVNATNQFMTNMMAEAPPPPKDGAPEMAYVATFYPKTTDPTLAASVDVAAGADLSGFVIQLQKSRVTRVKGKATGPDGAPLKNAQLMLMSFTNIGSMRMKMISDPQGKFEITDVQPGQYIAMTIQMNGSSPTMHMQPLTVPNEGLNDVQLGGQTDGTVTGNVVVAGEGKVALKDLRVSLGGEEVVAMPVFGTVSETGAFTLNKVSQAQYEVSLAHVPDGAYLQSVQWGGREMLGKPVDFSAGFAGALKIVLGTDGGSFETTVMRDDKPVSDATVVLLPADPAGRFTRTTKSGESDAAGRVTFKDVAPGSYLAFAWEKVEDGAWLDPVFLKPFENQGVKVTIGAKGHEKAELRLIPGK